MIRAYKFCRMIVPVLFFLSATLAIAATPDWVSGSSTEYPDAKFLIGRGVGSTEDEAQNRARGELASIFEVRIRVANENTTEATRSGNAEQVRKLSSQKVSAKTDKEISGIKIAAIWRDPVTKDFHALAVLSRQQAGARLREEIDQLDEDTQQQIKQAQAASDQLLKLAALNRALEAMLKREGFQATLRIVSQSGLGMEAPVSQAEIRTQIDEVLKHVQIAIKVADDGGVQDFGSLLQGGLASAGFLASSQEQADLVLEGKLTLTDLGRQQNWNWMRATLEVSLVEKATGRVRGSQTWPLKASAQDAATARSRVLLQVEQVFKQQLRQAIIQFASS